MRFRGIIVVLTWLLLGREATSLRAAEPKASGAYAKHVAPVLVKHCLACHGGAKPKGELALDAYKTDPVLPRDRQVWEKIAQAMRERRMPPADKPQPTPVEFVGMLAWIDAEFARLDGGKQYPGRVTLRRLNRAEYNNTIRDLVGVALTPADDFPADDVGYGFDNIGDVLSLSPILLEKYLAAADQVVKLAIVTEDTLRGEVRKFDGKNLHSTLKEGVAPPGFKALYTNGEVFANVTWPRDGAYLVRARAYGQQAGPDPARLAFRIDGKDVQVVDVKAVADDPQLYEVRVQAFAGRHRVSAAFINDYFNPKDPQPKNRDRNLYVAFLEVQGPVGEPLKELPDSHRRLVTCRPSARETSEACARRILDDFAARAYRRPVSPQELARLVYLVRLAEQNGDSFEKGIQLAVKAILVSPHFLFRVELDREPNNPAAVHPLNEFELATRLSYFLWSSMPDDELLAHARKNTLRLNLEAQTRRLLKDPKTRALVENFAGQWLQTRNLRADASRYPPIDEALRSAMIRETELFFEAVIKDDRGVLDFLDADYTFVNERLARHYGLAGVKGEAFQRVTLPRESPRGGVLTQAGILTVTSNPTRTSPVKRGKWILENILGTPPPPPPPDVPELSETREAVQSASLRQRLERHRTQAVCASCHQRMDPLGFGFENFDAVGAWRTKDGTFAIDASGTLPGGRSFTGPRELKAVLLSQKDAFARCLTEKMLTYALGRGLEPYDRAAVERLAAALAKNDYRFSILVLEIVRSDPFQKRRTQAR